MLRRLRVAAVQMESAAGDKPANLAKVTDFARQAAAAGAELVGFPECALTGYWFLRKLSCDALQALAEPVPEGPSTRTLLDLARETDATLGAGLVERTPDGRMFNTYVVAMPDGGVRWHRKLHAFVNEHLSCGDQYTVFDTPQGVRVGVLICYDNNLVENARITALRGAELLLAPHQTGGCDSRSPQAMGLVDPALWHARRENPAAIEAELRGDKGRGWLQRWLPSRAHDNGMFLLFSNGIGVDDNEIRTGNAMILDPYGRVLAETWAAEEGLVVAELDPELRQRATGVRWLRARRPELYAPLTTASGNELPTRNVRFEAPRGE